MMKQKVLQADAAKCLKLSNLFKTSCLKVRMEIKRQKLVNKEEAGIHVSAKFLRCLACKRKYSITLFD